MAIFPDMELVLGFEGLLKPINEEGFIHTAPPLVSAPRGGIRAIPG
jgi:hypothetical protein